MTEALAIISTAVDLLQAFNIGMSEWQKISDMIGKRIHDGRTEWTDAEKAEVQSHLDAARTSAVSTVEKLDK